ncbi:MAG TPA: hypothetical protein VK905_00570 [Bacillota bacterium]|nr:hypothetical protein [Bacillota bacterium]
MLTIRVNLEVMEALMYFWEATRGREKVNEKFINALASLAPMPAVYDEVFTGETVRKVLSAITNREPLAPANRSEGRFFNNNLWMLEDISLPQEMMACIKTLNLDKLAAELASEYSGNHVLTVYFAPLHVDPVYLIKDGMVLNFFLVQPDFAGGMTFGGQELHSTIRGHVVRALGKA